MNVADFTIVDMGDINTKHFVLEIMAKRKVFSVTEMQDALSNIAVNAGFNIQGFIEDLLDEGAIGCSVDGKYVVKNKWLIERQKEG